MRITVTIEDALAKELKRLAARKRSTFEQEVDRTLRAGLRALRTTAARSTPSHRVFRMGTPRIALDKALEIAAALEDGKVAARTLPR